MNLLDRIAKRRAALTDRIKGGKPFVCPVTRRYAQQISNDKLGYSDPGSSLLGVDEATASARFIISTQRQDRDGDVVISTGVQLESFRKNPVVLYGHGQDPVYGTLPIGKVTAIDVRKNHIEATLQFDVADPRAMTVFRKIADGYLNATSIGFMPLAGEELSDSGSEYWYPGVRFDSWELLEVSVVPTPANSEATLVGRSINNAKVLPIMATKQKWRKHKAVAKEFPPKEDSKPESVPAMEADTAKQAPQTDIQAVLCPKAQYADVNAATQWVTNHGFDASQPVEQPDAWAFVQFNADECDAATAESQDLGDGVTGVKCNSRVDPNKVHGDVPPNNEPGSKSVSTDCGGTCTCKSEKATAPVVLTANAEEFAAMVAKSYAAIRKAEGMSNDDAPPNPETPPEDAPADDMEKRPHSYRCLQALIAHVEEHMPQMDQPKVKAFYESILSKAKALMNSVHGEGDAGDDEMMDDEEDADEEAKSLDWARIMPALESVRLNQQRLNDGLALAMGRVP